VGLTHARRNMAGNGGVFAPSGSSPEGLTAFGKAVVRKCEALGILIDLAHLNPAGIEDVLALTSRPLCITHTNARRFFDIERNSTDAQMRAVAARGGVIGVNAVLVSPDAATTTLDRYVDHIDYMVEVAGIDHVGIGFDFFEFIYNQLPESEKQAINRMTTVQFIPDLRHHGHAPSVTRRLIERGYSDDDIEKVLYRNWMRLLNDVF
jgi:membrane dipeptidase